MHMAWHTEVRMPLDPAELGGLAPHDVAQLVFQFEPSITLLDSPWPIDQIWRVHQADEGMCTSVDLNTGGVALEIRRWEDDVGFRRLDPASYTFRTTLAAGHALAVAAEAALATSQEFDCVTALHELLTDGVIISFTL
jgi:hypothetical protein